MHDTVNGINMAWDDSGSGPAICLVHGFPLNRRMWSPQVKALTAAGYRVVTPDMRGFGESDAPQGPYSMDIFADDLVLLLDRLGIGRAVVGGMSMGGYVLLNLLERHPERIAAACFIVTRSVADDEVAKGKRLSMAEEALRSGSRVVADAFAKLIFSDETEASRSDTVAEVYRWMSGNKAAGVAGALLAMRDRKDYTPMLSSFSLPSLIIGADQDKAATAEHMRILESGLPDGRSRMISGAGHLVNLEKPQEFNHVLLDFLGSLSL